MKILLTSIGIFFAMVGIFFVHLFFIYILPHPFSNMNIIMATIILIIVLWRKGSVIWVSIVLHFFVELYSATPFGIILLSSTASVLCGLWAYRYLVTNKSWYAVAGITVVTVFLFRACYTIMLFFISLFYPFLFRLTGALLMSYMWEIICTTTITVVFYYLLTLRKKTAAPAIFFLRNV